VAARRPRVRVSRAEQQAVVERFLAALQNGDVQGLLDVLAPEVVLRSDGGGVVASVRHPIEGAERVARFLAAFAKIAPGARVDTVWLNGAPAARIDFDGEITAMSVVIESGRITGIYAIRNPHKLTRLGAEAELSR
jgi:RNA polymerase sigma-70 factor (ECF subfamily)